MSTIYDADSHSNRTVPSRSGDYQSPSLHDLPDIYEPRRRRLPPIVLAGGMFMAASVVFFGAETYLPLEYKPSHFVGGYQRALAQARAEGELTARIAYDGRLKLIETDAMRWQERCRAGLQNANNLYQAAYTRANMFAQATADIQKQYAQMRYVTAKDTVGGEIAVANLATMLGFLGGIFDGELGRSSMDFAEQARQQALRKLDEAASKGITVSVDGWDTGLPNPLNLPAAQACELPASLAASQPSSEG